MPRRRGSVAPRNTYALLMPALLLLALCVRGNGQGTGSLNRRRVSAADIDLTTGAMRPAAARRSWEFSACKPLTARGFSDSLPVAQHLTHGRVVSIVERQAAHPFDRPQLRFTLTETGSGQTASKSFTFDFLWYPQCPGGPGQPVAVHLDGWHAHRLSVGEDRQLSESDYHEARQRTAPSRKNPSEPRGSRSARPHLRSSRILSPASARGWCARGPRSDGLAPRDMRRLPSSRESAGGSDSGPAGTCPSREWHRR